MNTNLINERVEDHRVDTLDQIQHTRILWMLHLGSGDVVYAIAESASDDGWPACLRAVAFLENALQQLFIVVVMNHEGDNQVLQAGLQGQCPLLVFQAEPITFIKKIKYLFKAKTGKIGDF